jgi:hypothetical protein
VINPDVFFPIPVDTSNMNFYTIWIVNNLGVIQAVTAGFMILIFWIWFWNFTKNWSVNEA